MSALQDGFRLVSDRFSTERKRRSKAANNAAKVREISARWLEEYEKNGGLFVWDEDSSSRSPESEPKPHAEFTNGDHSGTIFNSNMIARNTRLTEAASRDLILLLSMNEEVLLGSIDWVVAPAQGGITGGHELARQIGSLNKRPCFFAYADEEIGEGGEKRRVFNTTDFEPGARVMVFDDVITTHGSVLRIIEALKRYQVSVLSNVLCWVNRSGDPIVDNRKIVPLTNQPVSHWPAEGCKLCAAGSKVLKKPKLIEHWKKLTKKIDIVDPKIGVSSPPTDPEK